MSVVRSVIARSRSGRGDPAVLDCRVDLWPPRNDGVAFPCPRL